MANHMLVLDLPYPPSLNKYWRHVGAKVLTSEQGRQYQNTVAGILLANRAVPFGDARLSVWIDVYPPDKRKRDLDNTLKGTLDALQKGGLYNNDEQIDLISIERREVCKPGRIVVTITTIGGEDADVLTEAT